MNTKKIKFGQVEIEKHGTDYIAFVIATDVSVATEKFVLETKESVFSFMETTFPSLDSSWYLRKLNKFMGVK